MTLSFEPNDAPTIAIVVGEHSGDTLAAGLMAAVNARYPHIRWVGIGGPKMQQQGFESWYPMEQLAVMGFFEPLWRLYSLLKLQQQLKKRFKALKVDLFIGVDAPEFNLPLAKWLKQQGFKTLHYVSPTVWAWRPKRLQRIQYAVDAMLLIYPFEVALYQQAKIPGFYVGHTLADEIPWLPAPLLARAKLNLPPGPMVAILPGSRLRELNYLVPVFLQTIQWLATRHPQCQFVVALPTTERAQQFERLLQQSHCSVPIYCLTGQTRQVLEASDVVLVTSGTATLETMLYKKPMVIAYKTNALTYWLAKKLIKTPYIGLPNILAQAPLVPEYLQQEATPAKLGAALEQLLNLSESQRQQLINRFTTLHRSLQQNANQKAGDVVLKLLGA